MPGPQTPAAASFPIPPPAANLPLGERRADGLIYPTAYFLEFVQILWASIQGAGGIIDQSAIGLPQPGVTMAMMQGLLEQAFQASPAQVAPLLAAIARQAEARPLLPIPPMAQLAAHAQSADTASALVLEVNFTYTGDVTGGPTPFDGSSDVSTALTLATAQPAVHTWALAQTFTVAPVFGDQAGTRTALGLGTAAVQNTGTSGANVPLLNGVNTWAGQQSVQAAVRTVAVAFGSLPSAVTAGNGARHAITDSLAAPVYDAAAVGGGAVFAGVISDGAVWRYG